MFGFNEVDVATLEQWRERGEAFRLIDVRTPAEMARGGIAGAEPLPLHLIPLKLDELTGGDEKIVLYCQSGARSAQACAFLAQHGVDEVYNLQGGIMAWAGSGRPLTELALQGV
jgi:rhodanese-related sulfurtransferase